MISQNGFSDFPTTERKIQQQCPHTCVRLQTCLDLYLMHKVLFLGFFAYLVCTVRSDPQKSNHWLLYYIGNYLLVLKRNRFLYDCIKYFRIRHGCDSQGSEMFPLVRSHPIEYAAPGAGLVWLQSSGEQNLGICCLISPLHPRPWPLKSSTSAEGAALSFDFLPSGEEELAFLCRDFRLEWEFRWAAQSSALLPAVVSVSETVQGEENLLSFSRSF